MNNLIDTALRSIEWSPEYFSEEDKKWLKNNSIVFEKFCEIADKERVKGRRTGVRMVSNQVRWQTRVRSDSEFYKVNNNHVSLMSHAYNTMPERTGFFTIKPRIPLINKIKESA